MSIHLWAKIFVLLVIAFASPPKAKAQQGQVREVFDDVHAFLYRQVLLGNLEQAFLSHQPLSQRRVDSLLLRVDAMALGSEDVVLLHRLMGLGKRPGSDAINERVGGIYANGRDSYSVEGPSFTIAVNPLLEGAIGVSRQTRNSQTEKVSFVRRYARCGRLSGTIGERWYFDTRFTENVRVEPPYVRDRVRQRINGVKNWALPTLDYLEAFGTVGYYSKHFEARVGREKHLWGSSRNALMLSNHGAGYDYAQFIVTLGRLQYSHLYASFVDTKSNLIPSAPGSTLSRPFRYGVFHRLAWQPSSRLELGVFEGMVLAPEPGERPLGFYFTYFNPLIFLRAVDFDVNSPGNVLLGLDWRWTVRTGVALRGQFFIDEFVADAFLKPDRFDNTVGGMVGVDVLVPELPALDLSIEYTRIRPYTYSNFATSLAYVNANGFLGYPLGANAHDLAIFTRWRVSERIQVELIGSISKQGVSTDEFLAGESPFVVPYGPNREKPLDAEFLQGIEERMLFTEGRVSLELLPQLFIEGLLLGQFVRRDGFPGNNTLAPSLSLRWGTRPASLRY